MRRYSAVLLPVMAVIVVALVLILGSHGRIVQSGVMPGAYVAPKSPFDLALEDAQRRLLALESVAPDFAHANFGPGTRSVAYRVPWIIGDALVTSDGTLYVTVTQPSKINGRDQYSVGTLYLGSLHLIPLPQVSGGYVSMVFAGDGSPPIVAATNDVAGTFLFALTPYSSMRLPYTQVSQNQNKPDLTTGERCSQPKNPSLPYVLYARSLGGLVRPLLPRATLARASLGLITDDRLITMYCTNFNGENFVTATNGDAVVFRLGENSLQLMSRGSVSASGPLHMLIWQSDQETEGTLFQDYLEVVSNGKFGRRTGGLPLPRKIQR